MHATATKLLEQARAKLARIETALETATDARTEDLEAQQERFEALVDALDDFLASAE